MLQKYCACHQKVGPRHTNPCNRHAKWSPLSNISLTWNLQPFHGFSVRGVKHRHYKPRNPCASHANSIISDPLHLHHACQRFCNPHNLLRLPRISQRLEIPAPATRKALGTSKNVPRPRCFNDFDFQILLRAGVVQILATSTSKSAPRLSIFNGFGFQIVLAHRRGANFGDFNFQKCSDTLGFERFWLPNRSRAQAWCKFWRLQLQKVVRPWQFFTILTSKLLSRAGVVQICCDILGSRSSAPARS